MRLGIDFGTTNSAAAVYDGEKLHPIQITSPKKSQILPSLLYVDRQHQAKMGLEAAAEYAVRETGRAVHWRNRKAGLIQYWVASTGGSPILVTEDLVITYDDAALGRLLQSIKTALRLEHYHGTQIFDRFYTLDELIELVLSKLKTTAEEQLGEEITEVVVGRPVKFSDKEWISNRAEEIIYKAAWQAGFRQISFQPEPIGALYVYHVATEERTLAFVFDFGGGTLDLTVAEVGGGTPPRVLATRGVLVGGDDLDTRIMQSLLKYFGHDPRRDMNLPHEFVDALRNWQTMPELSRPHQEDILRNLRHTSKRPETIDALRSLVSKNLGFGLFSEIERAKRELSTSSATTIKFERENIRINERISRIQFELMIKPELRLVKEGLQQVLQEAGVQPEQIEVVLRTGGSSLIPAFISLLNETFGEGKLQEMDPLVSVVGGLSIIAHEDGGLWGDYRAKYVEDPSEVVSSVQTTSQKPYSLYFLHVGQHCYADQDTVISKIPVELSGLPAVVTAYADRDSVSEDLVRLHLTAPSRVYIAYTMSALNTPSWMANFHPVDERMIEINDDWYGARRLQLYSQDFPAGEVILGGNAAAGSKGRLDSTYLIVVERF